MAVKHCAVCGKEFIDYGRGKYCRGPHYKTCCVCGNDFEYDVRKQVIPVACSKSCRSKLARKSMTFKPKICTKCGQEFTPRSSVQKFCSNCKQS